MGVGFGEEQGETALQRLLSELLNPSPVSGAERQMVDARGTSSVGPLKHVGPCFKHEIVVGTDIAGSVFP